MLLAYLFFLAKVATLVIAIVITLASIFAISSKGKKKSFGKITIKKLNTQFKETKDLIAENTLSKKALKQLKKNSTQKKRKKNHASSDKSRLFIVNFNGDLNANETTSLREIITAIILSAKTDDRVLIKLDSGGGLVNSYGLASSQIQRLREANIHTTVAVDKVAASGGYMMASVADRIIAAPFAIIGSIGVLAQIPNFHRFLDKQSIDFEQVSAGQYKRTLSFFGKNTKEGRIKLQEELEETHQLFQTHISQYRPQLDLNTVATGEHWYGTQAIDLQLIDQIKTSDDFILEAHEQFDLFELHYELRKSFLQRLMQGPQNALQLFMQLRGQPGQDYINY
tara:strand:+ start:4629 stop:5645 length:1017 start_codon:yes stop_codon:yes gene_type:complete